MNDFIKKKNPTPKAQPGAKNTFYCIIQKFT